MKTLLFSALLGGTALLGAAQTQERLITLNEGVWPSQDGEINYLEGNTMVSNTWYADNNDGAILGPTPNNIIKIDENRLAIAVNWNNTVTFIDTEGHLLHEVEDVQNNRKLATDGEYVYVTAYNHDIMIGDYMEVFEDGGFLAKISLDDYSVVAAIQVGWEPEGVVYYGGKLFVANTGGYSFQEAHDYETTVMVIDPETMTIERTIDTGKINLYGDMHLNGQYILLNSAGDYYSVYSATVVIDAQAVVDGLPDEECFATSDEYGVTYNTPTRDGKFYAIGSQFSYDTMGYEYQYLTIDPAEFMATGGTGGVEHSLPGEMEAKIRTISYPYGIYENPYTGYLYATDGSSSEEGGLYQFDAEGNFLATYPVGNFCRHFLALPDKIQNSVTDLMTPPQPGKDVIYNLQGMPVEEPVPGQIYISKGKKFVYQQR